jgi:hypothetical protein
MYKRLAAAVCAVVLMGLGAGAALAGEVKGPPTGGAPNTNYNTAATSNANSLCVYSGLNDFVQGQMEKQTQTPADFAPGDAGHGNEIFPDGCRGGSN